LACEALRATLGCIRAGQREFEVGALLEGELRRRGSEWHPFQTIVASESARRCPTRETGDRTIGRGDLLLIDFGAQLGGYCSDVTRTVVIGKADERQRAVYGLVREAQLTARTEIRAGMTGRKPIPGAHVDRNPGVSATHSGIRWATDWGWKFTRARGCPRRMNPRFRSMRS